MKAFFLLLQHRKIAKAKKQAFFKLNYCQKDFSIACAEQGSFIILNSCNFLLANTRKSLKFFCFESAQILVSLISLNFFFFCLYLVYFAAEADIVFNWNDRRSRRVFLCFYSAIFQLTSAKFQTFAYNSRTVGSSYMKFGQQFKTNELHVSTKFRGNRSRDFGFRTRKPPRKVGVKSGLSQKRLKYGKKYFIGWYVSR